MSNLDANLEMLQELLGKREDLHPDLVPYLDPDGPLGPSLKHPLVFSVVHTPTQNAWVNAGYQQKRELLQRAHAREDWHSVVWLHERPYRLDAFRSISWRLEGPDYWELLGSVWTDTENQWQNRDEWREMLTADDTGREMMSCEDVRCVFELPPEEGGLLPQTRIYRGYCRDDGLEGFSWTLDKARAKWFARRLHQSDDPPAKIASGMVAREHVIAYITSRDEQEIVCLPEHVTDIDIKEA